MEHTILKHQFQDPKIDVIILKNQELEVHVTSLGCTLISLLTKDKQGQMRDVILGFDNMELYQQQDKYIGAIVGRCAGRIKNASFTLHDQLYTLAKNNGENNLHGGIAGFHSKIFKYDILDDRICFYYMSKDLEEGYPGNLKVTITYALCGNKLIATYDAICDKDSVVNITNHMYFNLAGKGNILDHELQIHAKDIICNDEDCCANGIRRAVQDTPFDFREIKAIGKDIHEDDEQLRIGGGYDHYFIFDKQAPNVILQSRDSGILLEVTTNQIGCQIYTANFLDGTLEGKNGWRYQSRDALCIETQAPPNAIHTEEEPSTLLRASKPYHATTTFTFTLMEDAE